MKIEEQEVTVGIWDEGIHFNLAVKKPVADRMGAIRSQDPERWKGKEFELLKEAHRQLEAEQQKEA